MARPRAHLNRAPIVEAVIDFRVLVRDGSTADQFAGLGPRIGQQYNRATLMQSLQARFGVQEGVPLAPRQLQAAIGWLYQRQGAIAQFRVDGFTFSKLEPYTTWPEVFGEAHRLWGMYSQIAQPLQVTRIAVRYVNRLRLPAPATLSDYLTAPPVLPAPIPQTIREFLSRVVVDDPQRNLSAILIQASETPMSDPYSTQVLLDIDAFREISALPNDPSLSLIFEQLRALKNEVFFASIHERTVEMYE